MQKNSHSLFVTETEKREGNKYCPSHPAAFDAVSFVQHKTLLKWRCCLIHALLTKCPNKSVWDWPIHFNHP